MKNAILITGANGFIGSHLVELLLEEGVNPGRLRLLIPNNEQVKLPVFNKLEIIRGDITDKSVVKTATRGVSSVYHLAALTIEGGKYYSRDEYEKVNVQGTRIILNELRKKNIKKFIFFSSIAVYGLPAWVGDIRNWNESQPMNPHEIYGESKMKAEKDVESACRLSGIPYAIIRPTSVYGPRDKRNLLELFLAIKNKLFLFIGDGENKMDYVYVKDVAKAARLAELSRLKSGDYIIGSGKPLTQYTIASYVGESIGRKVPNIHIPKSVGLAVSYIILYLSKFIGVRPILFPHRVRVLTTDCYYDISKARRELSYEPKIPFRTGVKLTADWLFQSKLI